MKPINHRIAMEARLFELPHFNDLTEDQRDTVVRAVRQAVADERRLNSRRRPRLRVVKACVEEELEQTYGSVLLLAVIVAVIAWVVPRLLDWLVSDSGERKAESGDA